MLGNRRRIGDNAGVVCIVKLLCVVLLIRTSQSMHLANKNNNNNNNDNNNNNNNNNGPLEYSNSRSDRQQRVDPALYLQKLGYLPGSDFETAAMRTEEEFKRAVRKFQKFANVPLTGVLDNATKHMMSKSRCGVQDVLEGSTEIGEVQNLLSPDAPSSTDPHGPQGYVLGPSKWQKRYIKYRFLNFTPDLSRQVTRDSINRAFRMWSDTANLTFEEVENGYADIYIVFAREYHQDGYPFDRQGGTLAHAFFPGEGKGGDVHFDDDELWTEKSINGTNLFIVGAHEIGHALGLAHSYDQKSLMYPWYKGYTPNYTLSYDDIYAIQTIYGPKTIAPVGPAGKNTPTTRTTTKPTTTRKTVTTTKYHHHHHHPTHKMPLYITPDDCDISVDAISIIRSDYFFFKGKKFYRFNRNKNMTSGATDITIFWTSLPKTLEKVDAVFESSNYIYFFIGNRYWKFYGNSPISGFPRGGKSITNFNLPTSLTKIDAAFRWKHNNRVYLISGDMYWRLDEKDEKVAYGYPRDMSMWGGVRLPVDAAFTDVDGITYFFNGPHFWPFNTLRMQVRHKHPHEIATHWLKCPAKSFLPPPVMQEEVSFKVNNSSPFCASLFISAYVFLVVGYAGYFGGIW